MELLTRHCTTNLYAAASVNTPSSVKSTTVTVKPSSSTSISITSTSAAHPTSRSTKTTLITQISNSTSSPKAISTSSSKSSSSPSKISSSVKSTTISSTTSSTPTVSSPAITSRAPPALLAPTDYASIGLYYHNKHRLNHSAPTATWNSGQAIIAAEIASSCVFAHNMTVSGGGYGQNLAAYGASGNVRAISPSLMLATSITNQWYYGEVNNFLASYYGLPTPDMTIFSGWGHFSQVVWKGSATVGCASQFCATNTIFPGFASWFTVCNYTPQGNYIGEFGVNVGRSLGQPTIQIVL
ncbi:uncharacterized protein PAC_06358 [Phialocephala subalpina]|uniref:SCP domain-containing protein n=1 Tax=Phialocephala subalpina TaxID=576137 RepID=A0A1L7WUQ3_9HELO|nr:uncharacterized protein PAC_06358 [Phialocephala subalpina]